MFRKTVVLMLFLGYASSLDIFQKTKAKITKISCDPHPKYVTNVTCTIKAINRHVKTLKLGANMVYPLDDVLIRFRQLKKTHANRYMPGLFDIKRDYCELMNNHEQRDFALNIVEKFQKGGAAMLEQVLMKCPIQGFFWLEQTGEAETVLLLEPGEYMNEIVVYSSQNVTYNTIRIFLLLKAVI